MSWPDSFLEEALQSAEEQDRFRRLRSISRREGRHFEWLGQRYVNFSSNDYLGLSQCQSIKNISAKAVEEWGVGSTASRLVAGNLSLHEQLEQALCQWKGAEAALVFNSGYQANLGIMQALLGAKDQVFADRFIHASLIDGIKLSQARLRRYRHNDYQHLEKLLRENTKKSVRSVIVSESVFSMDGDFGDLDELCRLAEEYDCLLVIDDAHGSGISGEAGRGPCSNYLAKIDLLIGTFGKALGSFGAYALCSEKMRHYLINFCRSFIYTTSLPPAVLEANRAVIELLQTPKGQEKVDQLQENISFLSQGIQALGLECPAGESAIFPLIVGGEKEALLKAEALLERGIFCQAIRPPTVPAGTSRLRLTITAEHTMEDLKKLLGLLKNA